MPVRTVFYHALSAVADLVGYFCCPGNEIAMRVIIGQNDIRSLCAPCTGFTVENATILLAVPQGLCLITHHSPSRVKKLIQTSHSLLINRHALDFSYRLFPGQSNLRSFFELHFREHI